MPGRWEQRLYVGVGRPGMLFAPPECALLVIGPPRSGKTTCVVVPNVLGASGAVLSTSTKPDVMSSTLLARSRLGRCRVFDPSASTASGIGCEPLTWSPVHACLAWEGSLRMSRALVGSSRAARGIGEDSHWSERAGALLSSLLHAAALSGEGMGQVLSWVHRHHAAQAQEVLVDSGSELAADVLEGIAATEERERSAIFSTAAGVLAAYRSSSALASSEGEAFDPRDFVGSPETVYVCAPAREQDLFAPLIAGLIEDVRSAAYERAAATVDPSASHAVVLALDEVANMAPLPTLPAIAAEGGGQGLLTLACLQDLSQARARWGEAAKGFLTLFSAKLVLRGVADIATLEALSALSGEHDVAVSSRTRGFGRGGRRRRSSTTSLRRQRRLGVSDVSLGRPGRALYFEGGELPRGVELTHWEGLEPWASLGRGEPPE